jgi:hypothetical protein
MNFVSNLKPNDRTKYHSMSESKSQSMKEITKEGINSLPANEMNT